MNLLKVEKLLKEKKISINSLSKIIGMSNQNLYKCFEKNRIEASDLEKIAKALNVPISYFFEDNLEIETNNQENKVEIKDNEFVKLKEENEKLKMQLDFYKQAVEMKDLLISQILDVNKMKENNSSDGKAKKSA